MSLTTAADTTIEDLILAALVTLAPAGHAAWGVAPVGTVEALLASTITCYYVAQFQAGFNAAHYAHSHGLAAPVVVRVLAASDANARTGRALAVAAMQALTSPTGYAVQVKYGGAVPVPREPSVYTRADLWDVTVRRRP